MSSSRNLWRTACLTLALSAAAIWGGATPVHAAATHSSENFILATGTLDGEAEMVVCLDIVSGTLTGHVINTNSRKFFGQYVTRTVATDLGVTKGKNPKYTLVTGGVKFKPGAAGNRLGSCVVYIAEETSGKMVAYGCQWESSAMSQGKAFSLPFQKLGVVAVGAGASTAGGAKEDDK